MKTIIFIKKKAKKEETTKKQYFLEKFKNLEKSLNLHFEEPIEKICINISV